MAGGRGGIDPALEAVLKELWQHAGVIDMGVGHEHGRNGRRRDGEGDVFKDIDALFHAAVDKIILSAVFQQGAAAGHLVCRTDERDFHTTILL